MWAHDAGLHTMAASPAAASSFARAEFIRPLYAPERVVSGKLINDGVLVLGWTARSILFLFAFHFPHLAR